MAISSRTPEGLPHRCGVCGEAFAADPSYPGGDSCCPACGSLLWWFRDRLGDSAWSGRDWGERLQEIADMAIPDSLDLVELVMEMEEQFDLTIDDDAAGEMSTIADVIRYLRRRLGDDR